MNSISAKDFYLYSFSIVELLDELHKAVLFADFSTVKKLIEARKVDTTSRSPVSGNTILHYFATKKITKYLIRNSNLDINSRNNYGKTPLHMIAEWADVWTQFGSLPFSNYFEIMKTLLKAGADCNTQNNKDETALHTVLICMGMKRFLTPCSTKEDWTKLVKLLFSYKADPNISDHGGWTALHWAIYCVPYASITKLIIEQGANVNAQDSVGQTPLHKLPCQEDEYCEKVKLLLKNGADPTIQDANGRTVLHKAVRYSNMMLTDLLFENELSNKFENLSLSHSKDSSSILHMKDKNGMDALQIAVAHCDISMLKNLLRHGADANAVDRYGHSSLHYAAFKGSPEIIKCLKDAGGNPELADNNGDRPNEFALRRNYYLTATALYKENTDTSRQDMHFKFPNSRIFLQRFPCDDENGFPILNLKSNLQNQISDEALDKILKEKFQDDFHSFLKEMMQVDGFGVMPHDVREVYEIQSAIETFMNELTKCMASVDSRFKGEIFKSGSWYEGAADGGTKVGDPDEFDFMFCLTEFEKICSIPLPDDKYDDVQVFKKDKKRAIDEFSMFFAGDKVNSDVLMPFFVETCKRALCKMKGRVSLHENLYFEGATNNTMQGFFDVKSGITSCELRFTWCGAYYKYLDITVDLVPSIRIKSWPIFANTDSRLLTNDIIKEGCHVVCKSGKWRLSFSQAEQTIMKKMPAELRSAYMQAKLARDPRVTLHFPLFRDETKHEINGQKLVPSYLLKLLLFDCYDECMENNIDLSNITAEKIFARLHNCLQDRRPVPFYFMKKNDFLGQFFRDENQRKREHVAFIVHVINYFFQHKGNADDYIPGYFIDEKEMLMDLMPNTMRLMAMIMANDTSQFSK